MVASLDASRRNLRPSGGERAWLALLLATFVLVNLGTITRMPIPWGDEMMHVDPVASWYRGHGFVSGSWNLQRDTEFFAGYPPLYDLTLMGWVSVLGFGPVVVRSLDVVLAALVGALLWSVSWRLEIVSTARHRLLLVAAALGGYGMFVAYRSARPDCVGMLVCIGSLLASIWSAGRGGTATLFALGVLLPLAGLQTVFYAAVVYTVLIAFWPRRTFRAALPQAFGAIAGAVLLAIVYAKFGVLRAFLSQTVGSQTPLGRGSAYDFRARLGGVDLRHRLGALRDPSTLAVFVTLALVTLMQWRDRAWRPRSPAFVGAIIGVVVPASLFTMAQIPIYYAWMVYLPMVLCLAAAADQPFTIDRRWRGVFALWRGAVFVACVVAVPAFTLVALLQWHQRDPQRIVDAIAPQLRPDDRALIEPAAYYACLGRVAAIYGQAYVFSEPEARAVTVLIVAPWHAEDFEKTLGGRWIDTGAELVTQDEPPQFPPITYILLPTPNLHVYRRAG